MKAKLVTFEHSVNGMAVYVIPETDAEREFLRGLWRHGHMDITNGIADNSGIGFAIQWDWRREEGKP